MKDVITRHRAAGVACAVAAIAGGALVGLANYPAAPAESADAAPAGQAFTSPAGVALTASRDAYAVTAAPSAAPAPIALPPVLALPECADGFALAEDLTCVPSTFWDDVVTDPYAVECEPGEEAVPTDEGYVCGPADVGSPEAIADDAAEAVYVWEACTTEDQPTPCVWVAADMGNGLGDSFYVDESGAPVYVTDDEARAMLGGAR